MTVNALSEPVKLTATMSPMQKNRTLNDHFCKTAKGGIISISWGIHMLGRAEVDPSAAPTALPFARTLDDQADRVIIGFPARPGTSAFIDPATGEPNIEIARRLREIFGTDHGRKYVAPGAILYGPGDLPGDTESWIASHDCTTLGGNSGSVLIQFNAQPAVAGLHFSGAPMTANKAHALGKVDAHTSAQLPGAIWI